MPKQKSGIRSKIRVRKALIPAAGLGTRVFPSSKITRKELFPIIDHDGRAKPIIMCIVEEAAQAGIEEICLIVQSADRPLFEDFFYAPPRTEIFNKLSDEDQEYSHYLLELGNRVTFVTQDSQDGFGHAVYCAREWINGEPFLLMLGDHIYASDIETSCAGQMLDTYDRAGHSVVGLKVTPEQELHLFGCATGTWGEDDSILTITRFAEKPGIAYAREHLHVDGLEKGLFLTVFGQYVLTPEIFEYIEENVIHNQREAGEFQLTSCLDTLRRDQGFTGVIIKGRRFDIGTPDVYRQTMIDFRNA